MKLLTYKFLLFIFYLLSTVISYSAEQPNIKNLIIHSDNKKLKNIEFKNNFDEVIRLNDFRGKLVILNFWATWCIPCKHEMPSLDKLQSMNHLENLKIFPINVGKEKIEKVEKFFLELKIENLDLYFDDSAKLANSFFLIGIPTSIIINKKGEEFARIMGPIDFTDKKFVEWLSKYN
jgi:thiol-disulfide isomerase/thioredoxin